MKQLQSLQGKLKNVATNGMGESGANNLNGSMASLEKNILDMNQTQQTDELSLVKEIESHIQPYVKKGDQYQSLRNPKFLRPVSFDQSYELEEYQASNCQNGAQAYRQNDTQPNVLDSQPAATNHLEANPAVAGPGQDSISSFSLSVQEQFQKFDDSSDIFGLTKFEKDLFGDRTPKNHQKIKVLSKCHTQIYWLSQLATSRNEFAGYHMEQQIPKSLPNAQDKFNLLGREQMFFETMSSNKVIQ